MVTAASSVAPATLGGLAEWGARTLDAVCENPRLDAELLLAEAAGVSRTTIIAFPERGVGADVHDAFVKLIERRGEHVPVAYLTGRREFFSLMLEVGPGVLVPRPETELVVETALALIPGDKRAAVLDLGTGSGAIALAIKRARPHADIMAVDTSREALEIAQRNAAALRLDIRFAESDWFADIGERTFDLVVANPPYVESTDPALDEALRHEPRSALDGGPEGLDAVRVIVAAAIGYLAPGGHLLVEHGDDQAAVTRNLAEQAGYRDVRTLEDLAGRDRVLAARAP